MSAAPDPSSARSLRSVMLGALAFYAVYIARQVCDIDGRAHFILFDDAMISMRYAANLAHGHGLRWNIGEVPVEGYTNFLWTLVMALVHFLPVGRSLTSLVVMLLGAGLLVANVAAVDALADRVSGGSGRARLVATALSAFSAPLTFWTLVGMEVGLLALLLNVAAVLAFDHLQGGRRRPIALGIIFVAMALVRTDAVVAIACLLGAMALFGDREARWRRVPWWGLAVVATLALHTVARLRYYGDPLPNTFYLKATGVSLAVRLARGLQYLFWTTCIHSGALTALVLWWLARARRAALRPAVVTCAALFALQVAYSAYVGGDAWEYLGFSNRYLSVALGPLLALVGAAVADVTDERNGLRVASSLRVVLVAAALAWAARALQVYRWPGLLGVTAGSAWWRALVGASLVVAVGLLVAASRKELPGRLGRAFGRGASGRVAALAWIAVLSVATDAWFHGSWALLNVNGLRSQHENARMGLLVERSTLPGAHIADFSAGATPYFCDRPFIDLLGKSDRHIAHMPPSGPFLPGHNKWDYPYAIRDLRPDVVDRSFAASAADVPWEQWGYDLLPNGIRVRRDSALVDRAALSAPWRLDPLP